MFFGFSGNMLESPLEVSQSEGLPYNVGMQCYAKNQGLTAWSSLRLLKHFIKLINDHVCKA